MILPILIIAGLYTAAGGVYHLKKKHEALDQALSLVSGKGIVNLGSGYHRNPYSTMIENLPEVVYNVDLDLPAAPGCLSLDLEKPLPFSAGEFDVAFASHVLEHLDNWEQALNEWNRIANHVVVVLPNPLSITGWLHPGHKQHFSFSEVNYIREHWQLTTVYN